MKMTMVAALALLAAEASAQAPAGKGDALDRAQDRLTACFARSAAALDDRISDAGSVARGVLANCSAERQGVEEAARAVTGSAGLTVADRARVRDGLIDRATAVVLVQRKQRAP